MHDKNCCIREWGKSFPGGKSFNCVWVVVYKIVFPKILSVKKVRKSPEKTLFPRVTSQLGFYCAAPTIKKETHSWAESKCCCCNVDVCRVCTPSPVITANQNQRELSGWGWRGGFGFSLFLFFSRGAAFRRFCVSSWFPRETEVDVKAELTEERTRRMYNCRRHLHFNSTPTVCMCGL